MFVPAKPALAPSRTPPRALYRASTGGTYPHMSTESTVREPTQWRLVYHGYDPAAEPLREALCALGNGVFATRGAAPECDAGNGHYPGTYIAGVYNRLASEKAGRTIENESIVNAPNWLPFTFRVDDGDAFSIDDVEVLAYEQVLQMHTGLLVRTARFRDARGRETSLLQRRLVHMLDPHIAALQTTLRPENWSGTLTFLSAIDGAVENAGVERYSDLPGKHLEVLDRRYADEGIATLRVRTTQSHVEIAEAMRHAAYVDDRRVEPAFEALERPEAVAYEFSLRAEEGAEVRIEKVVALYTSRDTAISEPCEAATRAVRRAPSFARLAETHSARWGALWDRGTIGLDDHTHADMVLNLHTFHLLQTVSPNSIGRDVGVPARGLHGEAYRGHIFWDELFVFPYLNYRLPELARALLMYRYHRLDAARELAAEAGYEGALYPWQSSASGREETQEVHLNPESGRWIPDNSHRQYHIGIAVAFDMWQYFVVTRDVEFLAAYGMEMFIEIAKFWESIATYDEADDVYDIVGVMGPDEFHDADPNWDGLGLRNNTYTNVMVAWMFARVPHLLDALPDMQRRHLLEGTSVDEARLARWDDISRKLRIPMLDNGVPSQFQGYEDLEEFDWDGYRERYGDIQRLDRILEAEDDSVNRYKASKQADVLMLLFLLSYEELHELFGRLGVTFDEETVAKTVEYYLARTSHGSTLSRIVHSWVLARSDRHASLELFMDALDSDISDIQDGTTPEGIHLGAMAGTIDLIERGYSGMEVLGDRLRFKPSLPDGIACVSFRVYYRHRWLLVTLRDDEVSVESEPTALSPIEIECRGAVKQLGSSETVTFTR